MEPRLRRAPVTDATGTSIAHLINTMAAGPSLVAGRLHRAHPRTRTGFRAFITRTGLLSGLTTPVLYAQALPILLLDLCVTAYQWICFPIYGIERVRRGAYFAIDRHRLAYLTIVEKVNCTYCAYASGVIAYVREVTARTEAYWCPIKHRASVRDPHGLYADFFEFGDAHGYRHSARAHRRTLKRRPKASRA